MFKFALTAILISIALPAWGDCPPLSETNLNFDRLKSMIQTKDCGIKSVGDVIAKLPQSVRENFNLYYKSRSIQGPHAVDYLNPRALLFNTQPESPFVISFNGQPSQPGHLALEMLEFKLTGPDTSFRFHEIQFPATDQDAAQLEWTTVQKGISYSATNPGKCMACHAPRSGSVPRPIFGGYPDWEGAFASLHTGPYIPEEVKGLEAFYAKVRSPEVSRYQSLSWPDYTDFAESYQNIMTIDSQNGSLHRLLGDANARRVAKLAMATPEYDKFRFAILGALNDCDHPESFLPASTFKSLMRNIEARYQISGKWRSYNIEAMLRKIYDYPRLFLLTDFTEKDFNKVTFQDFDKKIRETYGPMLALQLDTFQIQGIQRADPLGGHFRLIFEGRGIDIGEWYMDLTQPTYRYLDGGFADLFTAKAIAEWDSGIPQDLRQEIAFDLSDFFSGQANPEQAAQKIRRNAICEKIKSLSLKSLANYSAAPLAAKVKSSSEEIVYPRVFKNTCATCHDAGIEIAPPIPYMTPEKMKLWLKDPAHFKLIQEKLLSPDETYRMPPTRALDEDELVEILRYLSTI